MGSGSSSERCEVWLRAAAEGNVQELRRLAEHEHVRLDGADSRGLTALMLAAGGGHQDCVRLLLTLGADLEVHDNRGWTATTHAAFKGHQRTLRLLAESGADLDVRDFLGATPVMRSLAGGHCACVHQLVEDGADLRIKDNEGRDARSTNHCFKCETCARLLDKEAALRSALPPTRRRAAPSSAGVGEGGVRPSIVRRGDSGNHPTLLPRRRGRSMDPPARRRNSGSRSELAAAATATTAPPPSQAAPSVPQQPGGYSKRRVFTFTVTPATSVPPLEARGTASVAGQLP